MISKSTPGTLSSTLDTDPPFKGPNGCIRMVLNVQIGRSAGQIGWCTVELQQCSKYKPVKLQQPFPAKSNMNSIFLLSPLYSVYSPAHLTPLAHLVQFGPVSPKLQKSHLPPAQFHSQLVHPDFRSKFLMHCIHLLFRS